MPPPSECPFAFLAGPNPGCRTPVPTPSLSLCYQVMDFLGAAAFSRAVQALDVKTNTLVCLKIVKVGGGALSGSNQRLQAYSDSCPYPHRCRLPPSFSPPPPLFRTTRTTLTRAWMRSSCSSTSTRVTPTTSRVWCGCTTTFTTRCGKV